MHEGTVDCLGVIERTPQAFPEIRLAADQSREPLFATLRLAPRRQLSILFGSFSWDFYALDELPNFVLELGQAS